MLHIVVVIHNNSLGRTIQVEGTAAGLDLIRTLAEKQLERVLTDQETIVLENNYEVYNDEDSDNVYCWALGQVE
jgi:hypothetical protein